MNMPFGKYKRWALCDIPLDYLKWIEENAEYLPKQLRDEINFEIERRTGDRPGMGRTV